MQAPGSSKRVMGEDMEGVTGEGTMTMEGDMDMVEVMERGKEKGKAIKEVMVTEEGTVMVEGMEKEKVKDIKGGMAMEGDMGMEEGMVKERDIKVTREGTGEVMEGMQKRQRPG